MLHETITAYITMVWQLQLHHHALDTKETCNLDNLSAVDQFVVMGHPFTKTVAGGIADVESGMLFVSA